MCGRYATTRSAADLSALFDADDDTAGGLAPDYNVAPTDPVPIVRHSRSAGARILTVATWGLVPTWAKNTRVAARFINARSETVTSSNAFAPSFERRRCLVPADGWYEWLKLSPKDKQAYFMTPADGSVLAFAGLWSVWGEGVDRTFTCSVLTTQAVGDLALVHDRMPLVLPPERWACWLDTSVQADAELLLAPPPARYVEALEVRPVGVAVGNVNNDGPELVARVAGPHPAAPVDNAKNLTLF
jgi:putative SOS response-associated peptidase YedK